MKTLIEINLPLLLGNTNVVIGCCNRRFQTRAEASRYIFKLLAEGCNIKDPFNFDHVSLVEVVDETTIN
jgi:hypothetical protein